MITSIISNIYVNSRTADVFQVACAPYKTSAITAFVRLLGAPPNILRDCIKIMKLEMVSDTANRHFDGRIVARILYIYSFVTSSFKTPLCLRFALMTEKSKKERKKK